MPKTWREKLNNGKSPHIELVEKPMMGLVPGQKLLVSTPLDVQHAIDKLEKGHLASVPELRQALAREAGADTSCPMTTGIFVRIVAECAWDEVLEGKPAEKVTPFWRVVEPSSPLAKKLRCGPEFIRKMRELES